jgi:hypothetical protein
LQLSFPLLHGLLGDVFLIVIFLTSKLEFMRFWFQFVSNKKLITDYCIM